MSSAEDLRVFGVPFNVIGNAVRRVLQEIAAKSIKWSQGNRVVKARMPFSVSDLFTGGQQLTITVSQGGEVWVMSENLNWRWDLDFGTNWDNCQIVLNGITRLIGGK